MAINSRLRTTLLTGLAVIVIAIAAALVIAGGDDDDGGADDTAASGASDPTVSSQPSHEAKPEPTKAPKKDKGDKSERPNEAGPTVARQRFCPDLDPDAVSDTLGRDGLVVLADHRPGDSYPLGAGQGDAVSEQWTCTIGEESGTALAVTWSIWGEPASQKLLDARLSSQQAQLGGEACASTADDALGPETSGIDCAPEQDGSTPAFAAVSRMAVVGDSLLECFLGSTDTDDMPTLQAAAPELCGMFLSAVSG